MKRNLKNAWWQDMVTGHDELVAPPGAPAPYEMTGLDCTIIMHPQVWKCSGHFDLFCDMMVDCRETKRRYRFDQIKGQWIARFNPTGDHSVAFITSVAEDTEADIKRRALKHFGLRAKQADQLIDGPTLSLPQALDPAHSPAQGTHWQNLDTGEMLTDLSNLRADAYKMVLGPDATEMGTLTAPREFNLMFKTIVGAMGTAEDAAFLRPETAQGIFVNFLNVMQTARKKPPFGIAQTGKSFRNEITP
ncbi:MAG: glycine--tRNA ligase, partial [Planctomycetales bacterium]|nr:glycine--tRNA ligase [Planctomycetales bacterium]